MFKGKLPIKPQFFYSHDYVIKKKYFVIKTEMKKGMMILRHHFFMRCFLYTGLSHCRGRHSGGGGSLYRIPLERDTWWLVYYLLKILWKKSGAKITRYSKKEKLPKMMRSWTLLGSKNIDIYTSHSAIPVEIIIDQPVFVIIEWEPVTQFENIWIFQIFKMTASADTVPLCNWCRSRPLTRPPTAALFIV